VKGRIWNLGMVGHLEDIAVLKGYQGKGLGKRLVQALNAVAENVGCCKVILNCSEDKLPFYQKSGFVQDGFQMSLRFGEGRSDE
jgi:glucosamine-phosphate N-acetyltransferase